MSQTAPAIRRNRSLTLAERNALLAKAVAEWDATTPLDSPARAAGPPKSLKDRPNQIEENLFPFLVTYRRMYFAHNAPPILGDVAQELGVSAEVAGQCAAEWRSRGTEILFWDHLPRPKARALLKKAFPQADLR